MRLSRHLARLAAITVLVGGTATFVAAASPAASASTAATQDGWVRIAHLSPKAPAMDMYMYPFGDPEQATVLRGGRARGRGRRRGGDEGRGPPDQHGDGG